MTPGYGGDRTLIKQGTYMTRKEEAILTDKTLTEHLSQSTFDLMLQVEEADPGLRVFKDCGRGSGKSLARLCQSGLRSRRALEQGLRAGRNLVEIKRRMIRAYRRGAREIGGEPEFRYGDPNTLAAIDHEVSVKESLSFFLSPGERGFTEGELRAGRLNP
jgi:hypothetical protein